MKKIYEEEFKLDLQLFNEGGDGSGEGESKGPEDKEPEGDEGGEEEELTQNDLDNAVATALAKEKLRLEKEYKAKLKLEKEEAARLAGLSAGDREKAILEKEMEDFKAEKAAFQLERMELEVVKDLAEKGLPVTFAKLLAAEDAETSLENIKIFETSWKEAIEKAVIEKLKGPGHKSGGGSDLGDSGIGQRLADKKKESGTSVKENPYF